MTLWRFAEVALGVLNQEGLLRPTVLYIPSSLLLLLVTISLWIPCGSVGRLLVARQYLVAAFRGADWLVLETASSFLAAESIGSFYWSVLFFHYCLEVRRRVMWRSTVWW